MAFSQESTASSGYYSGRTSTTATTPNSLNSHYLCYWRSTCNGQHELNECRYWKNELNGKLGLYYSSTGDYKLFTRDGINNKNLQDNPTGCTLVHLFVFNTENEKILFGLKWCKERRSDRQRQLQLTFPSANPYKQNGDMLQIPFRAFQWLTTDDHFANQCLEQGLKNRFLFLDANVIYPVHLTNEQVTKLTQDFKPNEEFQSLHWFPLAQIISHLPAWPEYILQEETADELLQITRNHPREMQIGGYQLWRVAAVCLMCIREHVPGRLRAFLAI